MKHTHHIIPKHMGGSDHPTNLIELTIEEHAEAHRLLYEKHGHWQDKVAWQGLLGLIPHEQIIEEMYEARRGSGNTFYGKKHTEETKRIISEKNKGKPKLKPTGFSEKCRDRVLGENNPMYGKAPWNKGKKGVQSASLESKIKKSRPVIYNGVEYYGIKEAARANGTTDYYIRKSCTFVNR